MNKIKELKFFQVITLMFIVGLLGGGLLENTALIFVTAIALFTLAVGYFVKWLSP